MRHTRPTIFIWTWVVVLLGCFLHVQATETDQYTAPPQPLHDLGPDLSRQVWREIQSAATDVNRQIARLTAEQAAADGEKKRDIQRRLALLRHPTGPVRAVGARLGTLHGIDTRIEAWVLHHPRFKEPRWIHRVTPAQSIYNRSRWLRGGIMVVSFSPTVHVHGVHTGLDKIGHFAQQGYQYHDKYMERRAAGDDHERAQFYAAQFGRLQELSFFGLFSSGIFSNADMAANYAGLKFYLSLTQQVKIGEESVGPLLRYDPLADQWIVPNNALPHPETLLKPFITDHFNEALNANVYDRPAATLVQPEINRRRKQLMKTLFPDHPAGPSFTELQRRQERLTRWHNEDYGHWAGNGALFLTPTLTP